ncbi:hypothetical protein A2V56_01720 [Candidatus Woesebacteria bacterium RBG_19FT_COMBO_42_9]|uniref:Cyclodeaminase/cyclohydrolase domain-containing protein n=1 Tax=Candidatus Woesebacteria bacterium RBG_16_42_24 TaxID=1802485 RepID=A0A1F7XJU6_9BACT|nr:MAG: hypothetical protein A2V97_01550 [Candidatus Woesebacteria bacterium RBG_16_42_24]OGM17545.1 MAG: hypothetical protein A2V56_01720 [Candidatus Woesebacteria bacterium RBG_19FT_COMBO_42_9]OGM67620.1 MAG: hypothetical protein A2985_00450 [Candidatus Woesebacteria bacterium RIFCSPLOWO2_01_FULL_43_11]
MKIGNQKINKFLEELGNSSPTPGGGAVAALVGAMAASLVEMVANLTIGKKGYEKQQKDIEILRYKAIKAKNELLELADEDVLAFNQVMAAYKSKDKNRIREALVYAIKIPGRTVKLSKDVAELAKEISKIGNKNAFSDAKSALHLAKAAVESAKENIKINKVALKSLNS